jgi:hypothetical protein
LQEECDNHAPCKEGEVILTGGYDLPAKHVLHAITPADYRTDALDVLRVSEPQNTVDVSTLAEERNSFLAGIYTRYLSLS